MSVRPVTDLTQDVRFAVAMAGGVSLAVWMGGVSREVNLLQQASDSRPREDDTTDLSAPPDGNSEPSWDARARALYRNLLELLDVTITVDVLSGTSAGGINAALLGMSSAGGADLAGLRDLWLRAGAMEALLRDPAEKNPPSLMQGDKVLFKQLADGIRDVHGTCEKSGEEARPTTVYITTTMMAGETSRFTDGYGTLVPDVDHHGLFTFDQRALAPDRLGHNPPASLTALALAARSSASFPGAFEPSFVPVGESVKAEPGIPDRPDMSDYANMTRSHWAADGGMLANRPLAPLLTSVFGRPADREVRRILAFVVPDGGGTANPADDMPGDILGKPFTLAGALRTDLNAQLNQSIASDLEAIRVHNERVQSRHDLRRTLAELGARLAPRRLVTPRMLEDYARQQGGALARPLLDALMRELTTMKLSNSWKNELSPSREADRQPIEQRLAEIMADQFAKAWTYPPTGGDPGADTAHLFEQVIRFGPSWLHDEAVSAFSRMLDSPDDDDNVFARAARFGRPALYAAQATAIQLVRHGYRLAVTDQQRQALAAHRKAVTDAVPHPAPFDDRKTARDHVRTAAAAHPTVTLEQLATQLANAKWASLGPGDSGSSGHGRSLADSWHHLELATTLLVATLRQLAAQDASQHRGRSDAARAVATYLSYLDAPSNATGVIASRLLDLAIAERALEPVGADADQPVEFIQVSANTRTRLSDQATVGKLRGVDLHHFAAFYKSSWRAYDWMWGRLDGCGWLVHILLDPRRILAVCEDHPDLYGERDERPDKFLDALLTAVGMNNVDKPTRARLRKSLQFLADSQAEIPVGLPDFAVLIAQAWQQLIAANELPIIAKEMLTDDGHLPAQADPGKPGQATPRRGRKPAGAPDNWAITVHEMDKKEPAQKFARMLPSCPVRNESLNGEMHTPAFAQTAAKALAVTTAAVATAPETPAQVRPVLASARTATRTGYRATQITGGNPRIMFLLGLAAAVIGGVLATQGMIIVGVTGTAIALAGLYLIVLSAWGISRGLLGALVGITVLAALASLTLAWVRKSLWGDANLKNLGWVPKHTLPWLSSTWWGGLAIIGGIILLAALLGVLTHRKPRRESPVAAPPPIGDQRPPTPPSDLPEEAIPSQTPVRS